MRFEIVQGETEHISITGKRRRSKTVLIRVGRISLSKKAFTVGAALCLCQVFDGILTFVGLHLLGTDMEGNKFLRVLMAAYGTAPILLAIKLGSIGLVTLLTFQAHSRRWIRPVIALLVLTYLAVAVLPWMYIISHELAAAT